MKTKEKLQEEKAAILKGIAHPVRLRVVEALACREMCVCDIAEMFHFDRTTISKHLAMMKSLGILESRKDGLNVYYSLRIRCLASLLSCVEKVVLGEKVEVVLSPCLCGSLPNDENEEET
ncbi:DNA-binding transcriptional ArsR family regulator [Aminivibrio pyruvatiphilus]|uniref:DNA-binding transcriptional ArsR family regulator n=1 Tax=Aminivibrio pyruvatiphilus TaxID=1005740 RepID=A0A4R8MGN3_9BACT|nr:metalloregulator ArsR/SmtB family transcription factor [Aminivibrio pyruvatiphilus]TDY65153.1 DNA-binding transcriptional ArsR family regulator [Aminivibrio pyruvatiphilus]